MYENQSAAEYVEYFWALEKLLANYHSTFRILLQSLRPRPSKGPLHRLRMQAWLKFEE